MRRSAANAMSAVSAAAHGEPLINAIRSFADSSIRLLKSKNRLPKAKISPDPPFDCAGTTGSAPC